MRIGEIAARTTTSVETIRYYERIGIMPSPPRTGGNYRDYGQRHLERLSFIRHARSLGFELEDVKALLALADEPERDCAEVDRIASSHLAEVEQKIERLRRLKNELARMLSRCRGGQVADCRIIEALTDHRDCEAGHAPENV